jgi:hypothetical protein
MVSLYDIKNNAAKTHFTIKSIKSISAWGHILISDLIFFDYVLFTALFQAITNVKRLKPGQIKPVGWIKELATNPPLIRVGWSLRSLTHPTRLISHELRP